MASAFEGLIKKKEEFEAERTEKQKKPVVEKQKVVLPHFEILEDSSSPKSAKSAEWFQCFLVAVSNCQATHPSQLQKAIILADEMMKVYKS